ncbi:hypothetical protein GE09DRAFT_1214703 [Coniochaeta sp. 2T2.1]|nr:hypothetical protein GE09DRAFT_1214703 [Coniochaeta sp. 2T2.1]
MLALGLWPGIGTYAGAAKASSRVLSSTWLWAIREGRYHTYDGIGFALRESPRQGITARNQVETEAEPATMDYWEVAQHEGFEPPTDRGIVTETLARGHSASPEDSLLVLRE